MLRFLGIPTSLHAKQDLDPLSRVCTMKPRDRRTDRRPGLLIAIVCVLCVRCRLVAHYDEMKQVLIVKVKVSGTIGLMQFYVGTAQVWHSLSRDLSFTFHPREWNESYLPNCLLG